MAAADDGTIALKEFKLKFGMVLHPYQEAPEAERRLLTVCRPGLCEYLILRFKATNAPPYPFEWVNYDERRLDYAAALSRISPRYQQRL